ncbi:MAG: elongation factor Ts [Gammaproteobacteria bacterium]|jgi:elongation factor Ts|nr:elongation factor Ts [Gammaproteobacteria bacterium]MBT3869447.1 elongation factor Ts [Gammaproteobacteria bacterium]MBT4380126.1 elongation factor Ts [Gammaproteobacteria bacterium]MBT4615890.1 elongation factor Ts [Gammaproteobacteria bacterium]MBT5196785.1 elongation factor Ts [Gammaproteobacteria bacterium]
MTAVSASMVKELRERTGLGMMDCKKALVDSDGDMEVAIENLRKSSGMKAAKKAGRIASDGLLSIKVDGGTGVIVEVNCETDFAARDDNFVAFVKTVTEKVFELGETNVEALGLETERENLVQKIGENISIRRAQVFKDEGTVVEYLHTNGRIGVMLSMEGGSKDLGKDVAMHIAAMNPTVVSSEDAPADLVAKEREIYTAQAQDSGKPPEIVEKMIDGRIRKYLAEISLLEQAFVKDGDTKIGALLKKEGAAVNRFVRYEVGEGIEKEEEDFAAEVQKQLGN